MKNILKHISLKDLELPMFVMEKCILSNELLLNISSIKTQTSGTEEEAESLSKGQQSLSLSRDFRSTYLSRMETRDICLTNTANAFSYIRHFQVQAFC